MVGISFIALMALTIQTVRSRWRSQGMKRMRRARVRSVRRMRRMREGGMGCDSWMKKWGEMGRWRGGKWLEVMKIW